jgi:transcriptional regulator with XRE-family HTH domain
MTILSEKLKRYREAKQLTQRQIALALDITIATVQNWESSRHVPKLTFNQTKKLCELLGVTLDDLAD